MHFNGGGGGSKRCDIASQPEPYREKRKGSNSSFLANAQVILPKYDSELRSEGAEGRTSTFTVAFL